MRIIAALLIGSLASQSVAASWHENNSDGACEIVGTSGAQQITYQFNGLLAEAGIELSSPRLKAHCNDSKSIKATMSFGSRTLAEDATIFCSGENIPTPTAIIEIGSLNSPTAHDLANADKIRLTLPGGFSETFEAAGFAQAERKLRQCVRDNAARWTAENSSL